jgi:hypothetical protein
MHDLSNILLDIPDILWISGVRSWGYQKGKSARAFFLRICGISCAVGTAGPQPASKVAPKDGSGEYLLKKALEA